MRGIQKALAKFLKPIWNLDFSSKFVFEGLANKLLRERIKFDALVRLPKEEVFVTGLNVGRVFVELDAKEGILAVEFDAEEELLAVELDAKEEVLFVGFVIEGRVF